MIWIVLFAILALICLICLIGIVVGKQAVLVTKEDHFGRSVPATIDPRKGFAAILAITVFLGLVIAATQSIRTVGPNEVGVPVTLGVASNDTVGSGPEIILP